MPEASFSDAFTPFTVTVRTSGNGAHLELDGELDLQSGPLLLSAVDWLLPSPARLVVLDCAALRFVDARGLATLLRARSTLADHGVELGVANPSDALRRILSATSLTGALPEMPVVTPDRAGRGPASH
ncbi:STAS domain-containing protein [Cryptosporangium phraense]|nr:STAS domain-containing protein [Cryptosporangium phraense]